MIKRNSLFLISNLGSEVSKIYSAKEKGDIVMFDTAILKAESIFSELKQMPETKNNKELNILADVIEDLKLKNSAYQISPKNLKSYFFPFISRLMSE